MMKERLQNFDQTPALERQELQGTNRNKRKPTGANKEDLRRRLAF